MSQTAQMSESDAVTEMENRFRKSIEKAEAEARSRLKIFSDYIAERPLRSIGVAFLVGFGFARLLQKLN